MGVLVLYHRTVDGFSRDHLRLMQGVTRRIAQAVENALKYRDAEERANLDSLTRLPNAALLAQSLKAELTRARRLNHGLAVVTCELTGLRRVYREQGPIAGDHLVQRVAEALRGDCREYDHLGRVSREEFAFVLPGMKADVLGAKLSRLNMIAHDLGLASADSVFFRTGQAFYPDDGDGHGLLLEIARRRAVERSGEQAGERPSEQSGERLCEQMGEQPGVEPVAAQAEESVSALESLRDALKKEPSVHERATPQ